MRDGWVAPGGLAENRGFQLLQADPGPDSHLVQILGGDNIRKAQEYQQEVRCSCAVSSLRLHAVCTRA